MSASFDLTRNPFPDRETLAHARWFLSATLGFLIVLTIILAVFGFLYAERWGASQYDVFAAVALVAWATAPPFWYVIVRSAHPVARMDLAAQGVTFHLDDGSSRTYTWTGSIHRLLWVDGRNTAWPKLKPGWPRTHVSSRWWRLVIPEEALDAALTIARSRGFRVERVARLEASPRFRGNVVYRISKGP